MATVFPFRASRPKPTAPDWQLRYARCAVALSMGMWKGNSPEHSAPGKSNEELANLVNHGFRTYNWDLVIAQFEVYDLLDMVPREKKIRISHSKKPSKNGKPVYLDTYEVLRQAWRAIVERDLVTRRGGPYCPIALYAHRHHWLRCAKTAAPFGMIPCAPPGLKQVPYDRDSSQRWTRSAGWFLPYNQAASLDYWRRGYYKIPSKKVLEAHLQAA